MDRAWGRVLGATAIVLALSAAMVVVGQALTAWGFPGSSTRMRLELLSQVAGAVCIGSRPEIQNLERLCRQRSVGRPGMPNRRRHQRDEPDSLWSVSISASMAARRVSLMSPSS